MMQVTLFTPYPHFTPHFKVLQLRSTAKGNSALQIAMSEWAQLEGAANAETVPLLPKKATNQVLSYQLVQLMGALAARVANQKQ